MRLRRMFFLRHSPRLARWLSIMLVALSLSLFEALLLAQNISSTQNFHETWEQLGRRQREFKELVRIRYALGEQALLAVQRKKLENLRLQLEWQMQLQSENPRANVDHELLSKLTADLFNIRATSSFSAIFDYRIDGGQLSLRKAFSQVQSVTDGAYESVAQRLEDEIEEATFRFHWPFLSDFLPLPGLTPEKLNRYRQQLDPKHELPLEIWEKLAGGKPLQLSEFQQYFRVTQGPVEPALVKHSFILYRSLGLLCFRTTPLTRGALIDLISKLEKELGESITSVTEAEIRLALLIHEARMGKPGWVWTEILKDFEWNEDQIPVLEFALSKYPMALDPETLKDASLLKIAIDRFAESRLEPVTMQRYYEASEQIESGIWAYLPPADFSFHELTPEAQELLLARLFPELTLREARQILFLRFFELSEEERLGLAQKIFRDPSLLEDFFHVYFRLKETSEEIVRAFHASLTRALLSPELLDAEEPLATKLLNGKEVPRIAARRAELFEEQTKTRLSRNATSTLSRLRDWLELQLNPYPGFWGDEYLRFKDVWERLELRKDLLQEMQGLIHRHSEESDPDRRLKLQDRIRDLSFQVNLLIQPDSVDGESFGILASAFAFGVLPQSASDWGITLVAAGAGGSFALLTSLLGKRVVIWFVIGDTGLAYVTAKIFSDSGELDLSSSISTPVGYGALAFWLDLSHQMGTLFSNTYVQKRIFAAERWGEISRELTAAGFGYRFAAQSQSLQIVSKARGIRQLEERVARLEEKRKTLILREAELAREVEALQLRRMEAQNKFGPNSSVFSEIEKSLQIKLTELQRIRGDQAGVSEARIFFYMKQSLVLGVDALRFLNPIRREPVTLFSNLRKRFSYTDRKGLLQVGAELRRLELMKADALNQLAFQESRPQYSWSPETWLKTWNERWRLQKLSRDWLKTQNELSLRWNEMKALTNQEKLSPESAQILSLHTERAVSQALKFARAHIKDLRAPNPPAQEWPAISRVLARTQRRLSPEDLPSRPEWQARALLRRQIDDFASALKVAESYGKRPKSLRAARRDLSELTQLLNETPNP